MDYVREDFRFKDNSFVMFETDLRQMYMHSHDCLEINLILSGNGFYVIEEKQYEINEGDIFIINNMERHMAIHNGTLKMLVLIFKPDFVWENKNDFNILEPFFNRGPLFSNRIRKDESKEVAFHKYFSEIKKEYEGKKLGWQMYVNSYSMLFLAELYRYCHSNHKLGGDVKSIHKVYSKIRPVLDYIHTNYMEQIELDNLAKHALMNKSYLCTIFKDTMHISIFEYIEQLRIKQACMLLKTTDKSITDISFEVGYNSVSYFNRSFNKVRSISPSMYRKKACATERDRTQSNN